MSGLAFMIVRHDDTCPMAHGARSGCSCNPDSEMVDGETFAAQVARDTAARSAQGAANAAAFQRRTKARKARRSAATSRRQQR